MKRFILLLVACLLALPCLAQTSAVAGFCVAGATKMTTQGLQSTNQAQGVIPGCTVTAYLTGTVNKATIYTDVHNTVLANPFTASITTGQWSFYVSTAACYDIVLSGGTAPNTYPSPLTIPGVCVTGPSSTINPIGPPYNCKIDGITDDTACWQAVCAVAQAADGLVLMPAGTSLVTQQICTISKPMGFLGAGPGQSTLSATGSAAIPALFDVEGTHDVALGGMTITCATGVTTGCITGLKVSYSSHVNLHDLVLNQTGYGTGTNPQAAIQSEDDYDLTEENIRLTGSGGAYELVNGYNGHVTVGLHQRGIWDENNLTNISLSDFNCQWCDITHSYVNQNNTTDSLTSDGYPYLYYTTNTTYALTSGCTGSGTLTCTVPLSGGLTQIPVAPSFQVAIAGVTGGTGTINGTWDATLLSSTTFSVSGAGTLRGPALPQPPHTSRPPTT